MNYKWDGKARRYFLEPIPRVERIGLFQRFINWIEPGFMWLVLGVEAGAVIYLAYLIYQVRLLMVWLENL
jgi:hypothetical protein